MITDDFHTITLTKEQYSKLIELRQMEENVKKVFKLLKQKHIILRSKNNDIFKLSVKDIEVIKTQEDIHINFIY